MSAVDAVLDLVTSNPVLTLITAIVGTFLGTLLFSRWRTRKEAQAEQRSPFQVKDLSELREDALRPNPVPYEDRGIATPSGPGTQRLVFAGPPGSGKTREAVEAVAKIDRAAPQSVDVLDVQDERKPTLTAPSEWEVDGTSGNHLVVFVDDAHEADLHEPDQARDFWGLVDNLGSRREGRRVHVVTTIRERFLDGNQRRESRVDPVPVPSLDEGETRTFVATCLAHFEIEVEGDADQALVQRAADPDGATAVDLREFLADRAGSVLDAQAVEEYVDDWKDNRLRELRDGLSEEEDRLLDALGLLTEHRLPRTGLLVRSAFAYLQPGGDNLPPRWLPEFLPVPEDPFNEALSRLEGEELVRRQGPSLKPPHDTLVEAEHGRVLPDEEFEDFARFAFDRLRMPDWLPRGLWIVWFGASERFLSLVSLGDLSEGLPPSFRSVVYGHVYDFARVFRYDEPAAAAAYNWGLVLKIWAEETEDSEKAHQRFDQATDKYDQATTIYPDNAKAWNNWGLTLQTWADETRDPDQAHQRYDQATEKYHQATTIDPDHTVAWYNWGLTLQKWAERTQESDQAHQRYEQATDKYDQATTIDPDHASAWCNWSDVLQKWAREIDDAGRKEKLLSEALDKGRCAEDLEPKNPDYAGLAGLVLLLLDRFEEGAARKWRACRFAWEDGDLKRHESELRQLWDLRKNVDEQEREAWTAGLVYALLRQQTGNPIEDLRADLAAAPAGVRTEAFELGLGVIDGAGVDPHRLRDLAEDANDVDAHVLDVLAVVSDRE